MTGTSETEFSAAEGVDKVPSYVRRRLGGVDILVNNVGGSSAPAGGFAALTDEDWQQALNQNLQAAVRLDAEFTHRLLGHLMTLAELSDNLHAPETLSV